MIKNIKTLTILASMALIFTGCTNNYTEEDSDNESSIIEDSSSSIMFNDNLEDISSTTSSESISNSSNVVSTKPTEKPVLRPDEAKPVTSSFTTKPVASTSTKPAEKPTVESKPSTASTTTTFVKPVEKPVESKPTESSAINCGEGKHNLQVMSAAEGPEQWHKETHTILDCGFDVTLAERCFPNIENPVEVFKTNLKNLGIDKNFDVHSVEIEIWGYMATVSERCTECDYKMEKGPFVDSFGEFKCRYIDDTNPIKIDEELNFNTIFYDPNNIPQAVIDNIKLMK